MLFYSYFFFPPKLLDCIILGSQGADFLAQLLEGKFDSPQLGKNSRSLFLFSPQPKLGRAFIKYRNHFLR